MQNTVTVSGPISFGTQYRATRAVAARSRVSLLSYGFFVGVPLLTLVIMLATGYDFTRPAVFGLPTWAVLLLGPAFMFVFLPLCHALNVWQMRRRNASVSGVLTFAVTGEGFESHGGSFDVRLRWDAIHRVVETRDFFLFYVAAAVAHFIPKACVGSPEELQAIRRIIHEAVRERAKLQAA
jgi:YcxB-like protein